MNHHCSIHMDEQEQRNYTLGSLCRQLGVIGQYFFSFIIFLCTTCSLFFCLLFLLTKFQYHIPRSQLKHTTSPAMFF